MAVKVYKNNDRYNTIKWNAKRLNLRLRDIYKALHISDKTLSIYIENPHTMQIKHLLVMAGLFGMSPEELLYLLLRNKPQVKGQDNKHGVYYLEDIRERNK